MSLAKDPKSTEYKGLDTPLSALGLSTRAYTAFETFDCSTAKWDIASMQFIGMKPVAFVRDIVDVDYDELVRFPGIGKKTALEIVEALKPFRGLK